MTVPFAQIVAYQDELMALDIRGRLWRIYHHPMNGWRMILCLEGTDEKDNYL